MNIPGSRVPLSVLRRTKTMRYNSTAPPQPPRPSAPPSSQSSSGGKVVTSVLLLGGGSAAGLGAYYYYDPNAELFRMARSALGISNLSPATNCEPQPAKKQESSSSKPVPVIRPQKVDVPAPPKPAQSQQQKQTPALSETKAPAAKKPATTVLPSVPVPSPPLAASMAATAAAAMAPLTTAASSPPLASKESSSKTEDAVPKSLLVTALRAQQEAITEAYDAKIGVIDKEYERKLKNATQVSDAERFVELKGKYHKASASLAAIEQGIEARQEQNTRARRLRALWAQVNGVHARVNHPEYHGTTVTCIDKKALLKSIEVQDKFVSVMVESLPNSPVHSLESLKKRFYESVEPVCKSVGLIKDGEGFSVWKYTIGRVLSGLVASTGSSDSKPSSPVRATHQTLDSARKALEKSDLLSAAIAVNKLDGLPRQVASDWLADARTLLETNQTLFVLMTYAASNNVF